MLYFSKWFTNFDKMKNRSTAFVILILGIIFIPIAMTLEDKTYRIGLLILSALILLSSMVLLAIDAKKRKK